MNNLKKSLIAAGAFTAAVYGANKLVNLFVKLEMSKPRPKNDLDKLSISEYTWRYGKVRYIKAGQGKPLLLIHGLRGAQGLADWEESILPLSVHYTVYALEFLGFGYSDKPMISYSAYLFAGLINDFIKDVIKPRQNELLAAALDGGSGILAAAHLLSPRYISKILFVSPDYSKASGCADGKIMRLFGVPIFGTAAFNIMNSRFLLKHRLKSVNTRENYLTSHIGGSGTKRVFAASLTGFLNTDTKRLIGNVNIPVKISELTKDCFKPVDISNEARCFFD